MKPPNPRNSQTRALSLLLVNTTLLPCWILTHLCRNSHPPTLLDVSYSYSAVPQLMQAGEKLSMSLDFVSLPPPKAAASFTLVSIGPEVSFSLQSIVCSKIRGICQMKDGTSWSRGDTGWPLWIGPSQPCWLVGQSPVLGGSSV